MRRILAFFLCMGLLCGQVLGAEEKYVALTFDDGPSGRFTRKLLAGLQEREVKATFLLCGYRLETYPELAEQIHAQGHEIGLHGYSHKDMAKMSRGEMCKELEKTIALLPRGCTPVFWRPPGGSESKVISDVAEQMGFSILSWSVDPRDWALHDAGAVETAVISKVRSGDVVLMHDLSDSSVEAALVIVEKLKAQGFRFVTVSDLARLQGVQLQPGKTYRCFPDP